MKSIIQIRIISIHINSNAYHRENIFNLQEMELTLLAIPKQRTILSQNIFMRHAQITYNTPRLNNFLATYPTRFLALL